MQRFDTVCLLGAAAVATISAAALYSFTISGRSGKGAYDVVTDATSNVATSAQAPEAVNSAAGSSWGQPVSKAVAAPSQKPAVDDQHVYGTAKAAVEQEPIANVAINSVKHHAGTAAAASVPVLVAASQTANGVRCSSDSIPKSGSQSQQTDDGLSYASGGVQRVHAAQLAHEQHKGQGHQHTQAQRVVQQVPVQEPEAGHAQHHTMSRKPAVAQTAEQHQHMKQQQTQQQQEQQGSQQVGPQLAQQHVQDVHQLVAVPAQQQKHMLQATQSADLKQQQHCKDQETQQHQEQQGAQPPGLQQAVQEPAAGHKMEHMKEHIVHAAELQREQHREGHTIQQQHQQQGPQQDSPQQAVQPENAQWPEAGYGQQQPREHMPEVMPVAVLQQQRQEEPQPQQQQKQQATQQQCTQLASPQQQQPGQLLSVPPPKQLQQRPLIAAGPPSERDKAIMYRLSIDKSVWDSSSAISSSMDSSAADKHIAGMPQELSGECGTDVQGCAAAGSSGCASSVIAAFERSLSRQASTSNPTSPKGSITSPRGSSSVKQRQSFNTAVNQPSLDTTVRTAVVARSLAVQYADNRSLQDQQAAQGVQSLSSACALLCKQHCSKLQEVTGEMGETTALDIGCGTGGSCFQLALSFSHVLGLDGDSMHVVAAKELKEKGQLEYRPVQDRSAATAAVGSSGTGGLQEQLQEGVCVARVSEHCDRDKVRFWCYPLPELPPKLQPVDAVLVEDVEGRLGSGLCRVCQQLPALLNPGGVCVVVVPGASSNVADGVERPANGAADGGHPHCSCCDAAHARADCRSSSAGILSVGQWLTELGLQFVKQEQLPYPVGGAPWLQTAVAGVWLQPK